MVSLSMKFPIDFRQTFSGISESIRSGYGERPLVLENKTDGCVLSLERDIPSNFINGLKKTYIQSKNFVLEKRKDKKYFFGMKN